MSQQQSIFLSYNSADKEWVRKLAAALTLAGAQVWFDEWTVRPGDSIPTAVAEGLADFDIFALVWSEAAANSRWVKTEMEAALVRWINGELCRLVPVRLDLAPIPVLLRSIRYIDGSDKNHVRVARELLGIESDMAFRMAVQDFINEAEIEFREFFGVGVLVACPRCGATPDKLEGCEFFDRKNDRHYVGAHCTVCGWDDCSET